MKVRVIKKTKIDGRWYYPSPEVLEVWPTEARKGIIRGDLEDIEGDFIAAYKAKEEFKLKRRKENKDGDNSRTV